MSEGGPERSGPNPDDEQRRGEAEPFDTLAGGEQKGPELMPEGVQRGPDSLKPSGEARDPREAARAARDRLSRVYEGWRESQAELRAARSEDEPFDTLAGGEQKEPGLMSPEWREETYWKRINGERQSEQEQRDIPIRRREVPDPDAAFDTLAGGEQKGPDLLAGGEQNGPDLLTPSPRGEREGASAREKAQQREEARQQEEARRDLQYTRLLESAAERASHNQSVMEEIEQVRDQLALLIHEGHPQILSVGPEMSPHNLELTADALRSQLGVGRGGVTHESRLDHPRRSNKGQPERTKGRLIFNPVGESARRAVEYNQKLRDAGGREMRERVSWLNPRKAVEPPGSRRRGLHPEEAKQVALVERWGKDGLHSVDLFVVPDGAFRGGVLRRESKGLKELLGRLNQRMDQPRAHDGHGGHGENDEGYDLGAEAAAVVGPKIGSEAEQAAQLWEERREREQQRDREQRGEPQPGQPDPGLAEGGELARLQRLFRGAAEEQDPLRRLNRLSRVADKLQEANLATGLDAQQRQEHVGLGLTPVRPSADLAELIVGLESEWQEAYRVRRAEELETALREVGENPDPRQRELHAPGIADALRHLDLYYEHPKAGTRKERLAEPSSAKLGRELSAQVQKLAQNSRREAEVRGMVGRQLPAGSGEPPAPTTPALLREQLDQAMAISDDAERLKAVRAIAGEAAAAGYIEKVRNQGSQYRAHGIVERGGDEKPVNRQLSVQEVEQTELAEAVQEALLEASRRPLRNRRGRDATAPEYTDVMPSTGQQYAMNNRGRWMTSEEVNAQAGADKSLLDKLVGRVKERDKNWELEKGPMSQEVVTRLVRESRNRGELGQFYRLVGRQAGVPVEVVGRREEWRTRDDTEMELARVFYRRDLELGVIEPGSAVESGRSQNVAAEERRLHAVLREAAENGYLAATGGPSTPYGEYAPTQGERQEGERLLRLARRSWERIHGIRPPEEQQPRAAGGEPAAPQEKAGDRARREARERWQERERLRQQPEGIAPPEPTATEPPATADSSVPPEPGANAAPTGAPESEGGGRPAAEEFRPRSVGGLTAEELDSALIYSFENAADMDEEKRQDYLMSVARNMANRGIWRLGERTGRPVAIPGDALSERRVEAWEEVWRGEQEGGSEA